MLKKKSLSLRSLATLALLSFVAVSVQPRQSKAIVFTPASWWVWAGGRTAAALGAGTLTGYGAAVGAEGGNHNALATAFLALVALVILDDPHNPGTPQLTELTPETAKSFHITDSKQMDAFKDALPEINAKFASIIHDQPANNNNLNELAANGDKSWAEFTPTLPADAAVALNKIRGVAQAE